MLRHILICPLVLAAVISIQAQVGDWRFTNYTPDMGAPDFIVNAMGEDSYGRVWIGGYGGLICFDGYNFNHFTHSPDDPFSLPDNEISRIGFVGKDTLLALSPSALMLYDMSSLQFTNLSDSAQWPGSSLPGPLHDVYVDGDGIWWIATRNGIYRIDFHRHKLQHLLIKADPQTRWERSFNIISQIAADPDNEDHLWLSTVAFPIKFNKRTEKFTPYPEDPGFNSDEVSVMAARFKPSFYMVPTHDGDVWMATAGAGLRVVRSHDSSWEYFDLPSETGINDNIVVDIELLNDSTLWLGTRSNGCMLFDINSHTFIPFVSESSNPNSILPRGCSSVWRDAEGGIWLAMHSGLSHWDPHNHLFESAPSALPDIFNASNIKYDKPGRRLHLANARNAYYVDLATNESRRVEFSPLQGKALSPAGIRALTVRENGEVLYGMDSEVVKGTPGIYKLNPADGQGVIMHSSETDDFPLVDIAAIYEDTKERLWVGARYKYPVYLHNGQIVELSDVATDDVECIAEDPSGNIWYGTRYGTVKIQTNRDTYSADSPCKRPECEELDKNIQCMAYDQQGNMWVGTRHAGLLRYDAPDGTSFRQFSLSDGLPGLSIICLEVVGNNMWIGTRNGLARLNTSTLEINTFNDKDGLASSIILEVESVDSSALYIGTRHGISVLKLTDLDTRINTAPPRLIFSNFTVAGAQPGPGVSGDLQSGFSMKWPDNSFAVEYIGVNHTRPEEHRYKYRLTGVDGDWINADKRRFTSYNNLSPGTYTLQVMASNNHGYWTTTPTELPVTVLPAFWQTLWFKILSGGAILLVGFSLYRMRIRQIRRESTMVIEFNNKLVQAESQALRAQMNPHFIFNALNSIKLYVLNKDSDTAGGYLDEFARLVRLVLQNSKETMIALDNELEALDLYIRMEKLRFKKSFEYQINVADDIDSSFYEVPPLLLQPFAENSIWHGFSNLDGEGFLLVEVKLINEQLHITIEDNGIGRKRAGEINSKKRGFKKSMGTQITHDRMELQPHLTGVKIDTETTDLADEHGRALGTRVEIVVDYNPNG